MWNIERVEALLSGKEKVFSDTLARLNQDGRFRQRQCEYASLSLLDALIQKRLGEVGIGLVINETLQNGQPLHREHFIALLGNTSWTHFVDGTYAQFDPLRKGFIIESIARIGQYYRIYPNGRAQRAPLYILTGKEVWDMWSDSKKAITPLVAALLD